MYFVFKSNYRSRLMLDIMNVTLKISIWQRSGSLAARGWISPKY